VDHSVKIAELARSLCHSWRSARNEKSRKSQI